jgi:hypothetical protein
MEPPLEPDRRRLQISLRTMFGIVTLLCVALSILIVPIERRRRAVSAIEKLGGTVTYGESAANQLSAVAFLRQHSRRG